MNILTVFGTRPEAIKMAPLVKALKDEPSIRSLVCVTGQHREMLNQVLQLFGIVPDFDLSLMMSNQTLNTLSARALGALDAVLEELRPTGCWCTAIPPRQWRPRFPHFTVAFRSGMSRLGFGPTTSRDRGLKK